MTTPESPPLEPIPTPSHPPASVFPQDGEATWVTQLRLMVCILLGAAAFIVGMISGDLLWVGIGASLVGVPGLLGMMAPGKSAS